jgi:hypothetical protein
MKATNISRRIVRSPDRIWESIKDDIRADAPALQENPESAADKSGRQGRLAAQSLPDARRAMRRRGRLRLTACLLGATLSSTLVALVS